jgi:predicted DNA-binding transcriptional regulator YafY
METDVVVIDYTNWKGVRSFRRIVPKPHGMEFRSSSFHIEKQWLIEAFDLDKREYRTFALKDIHSWTPLGETR